MKFIEKMRAGWTIDNFYVSSYNPTRPHAIVFNEFNTVLTHFCNYEERSSRTGIIGIWKPKQSQP